MRNMIKGILAVSLCVTSIQAETFHDKTFMKPRTVSDNLAMEYSTWHKEFNAFKKETTNDRFGGTIQAVPFYQKSTNKKDLGNYFGAFNENVGYNVVQDSIDVGYGLNSKVLYPHEIIHNPGYEVTQVNSLFSQAKFRPTQESYGVRLDYHQDLNEFVKGLFFKVNLPVVYVKNDMGIVYTGTGLTQSLPNGLGTGDAKSLLDYLSGSITTTMQEPLTHAKIHGSRSKSGVADIQVAVGYTLLDEANKYMSGFVQGIIPTSNQPEGEYLFEPVYGNGRHWGVGAGLDGRFEVWKKDDMSVDVLFAMQAEYLFKASEMRTLGYAVAGKVVPFGYYKLAGQIGKLTVFPAANVLTRKVGVVPGGQFEGMAGFVFNWGKFTFDLDYTLFMKERETIELRDWDDGIYGIVSQSFLTTSAFAAGDGTMITQANGLSIEAASTPAQVTHKLSGGFGYCFNEWKYPVLLGLGGSYEWLPGRNSGLEGYAAWAKVGIDF